MSLEVGINFSFKLLSLLNGSKESVIFSPTSILNGLAMVLGGARGETAKEIAQLIGEG